MREAIKLGKQLKSEAIPPQKCFACNGSGRYDTWGSPKCEACNGTGLENNKRN